MSWVDDLFASGLYLAVWPTSVGSALNHETSQAEADGVLRLLEMPEGSHILDWCGGYGRHSIELAKRGHRVTLLDYTQCHLDLAGKNAAEQGVELELIQADFRETPPGINAQFAVNLFTSGIGYYTEVDDAVALRSLYATLAPKAKVLIDTMNLFWITRNFQPRGWQGPAEMYPVLIELRSFDPLTSYLTAESRYLSPEGEQRFTSRLLVYTPERLARVMREAGFRVTDLYGDLEGGEFGFDSRRIVMIAEK